MPLYRIDPLHPSRLRCEACGQTVAPLPDDGEAPPEALTAGQAAHLWPALGEVVLGHNLLCGRGEEGPVYVHVFERG